MHETLKVRGLGPEQASHHVYPLPHHDGPQKHVFDKYYVTLWASRPHVVAEGLLQKSLFDFLSLGAPSLENQILQIIIRKGFKSFTINRGVFGQN